MIKQLLSLAAMAAVAVGAQADTLDLSLTDLNSGWDSSYDAETKTITYDSAWSGRGWWLGDADYSDWDLVVVKFEPLAMKVQLVVEYNDDTSETQAADAGAEIIEYQLVSGSKSSVKQIYLQASAAGTVSLTAAYLENGVEIDPNLLWEGETEISGWNSGAEFSSSKVSAGDVLEYTFSEAGSSNGQILLKGSDWNNLLGTAKISYSDLALGTVQVGVTSEMLDNCGGKIFIQGDGGCVVTKVAKVGTFDSEGVIAYGERVLATEVYATIPEDASEICLEFDSTPTWAQLCNSSWSDFELVCVTSEDGNTRTYTLTSDAISTINTSKAFVVNGPSDAKLVKVYIPSSGTSGVKSIETSSNAPVDVYTVTGQKVKAGVSNADAINGLSKGLYIIGGKKVLVK